jgi:hypothetical protein
MPMSSWQKSALHLGFLHFLIGACLSFPLEAARSQAIDFGKCELFASGLKGVTPPDELWKTDRRVDVFDSSGPTGKSYRVVGDVVELTPDLFPSLARASGQYLENISEISIDAREIIVAMPLRLASGKLRLSADKIKFGFRGIVSFAKNPGPGDQSFQILARELGF